MLLGKLIDFIVYGYFKDSPRDAESREGGQPVSLKAHVNVIVEIQKQRIGDAKLLVIVTAVLHYVQNG